MCIFLIVGRNIFYTTEASANHLKQLLFIVHCFNIQLYSFQTIYIGIKQTLFSCYNIPLRSGKSKPPSLGLASHSRNDMIKVFDLPTFHKFMGKTLLLCAMLHYVSTWPGCDQLSKLQFIVRVRITVRPSVDLMVLFVTNKPLTENRICVFILLLWYDQITRFQKIIHYLCISCYRPRLKIHKIDYSFISRVTKW